MDLFEHQDDCELGALGAIGLAARQGDQALSQFFTPVWAAEALVHEYFSHLTRSDLVLEPSCGTGSFLHGLPREIPAVGVEIDPALASVARRTTGREVITGDFRVVNLSLQPTCVIGNPPFDLSVFDGMLDRCHALLPEGGMAGFILPTYALQTPSRVLAYNEKWSMKADHLPRTLFPNLSKPLVFAMFQKDLKRTLVGFALYRQVDSVSQMRKRFQELLATADGSAWRKLAVTLLGELRGEASLEALYRAAEGRRPSANPYWREQLRKQYQDTRYFRRTGEGRYALAA